MDNELDLLKRINELEDKVESLRLSRRVLLGLLDDLEINYKQKISQLERELESTKKKNKKFARQNMNLNIKLVKGEEI